MLCLVLLFVFTGFGFTQNNEAIVVDQRQITKTYDMEKGGFLNVDNKTGDVRVTGWNSSKIEINIYNRSRWDDFEVYVDKRNKSFYIEIDYPHRDRYDRWGRSNNAGSVTLEIKVPRETELKLYSMNGSVDVKDIDSNVDAEALNGGVEVRGIKGVVDAHSTNSRVEVFDITGDVDAHSTNSRVIVRNTGGDVRAKSINSSVEVVNGNAERVEASSVNSSVEVELGNVSPRGSYEVRSTNGSVRLYMPADSKADITARVKPGDLRSDFDVFDEYDRDRSRRSRYDRYWDRDRPVTFRGELNGGGARIHLSTTHGHVDIRKK